ncbi:hypothetical protein ABSA28_00555 [Candidatus Hepatincolaceae symbiont of Richtersius coronifer]
MDIHTDNNDNLKFEDTGQGADIALLKTPIYPVIALRNYLRKNKYQILQGSEDINNIYNIIINKALELNLNPNSLILNQDTLKNGEFNLKVKLTKA